MSCIYGTRKNRGSIHREKEIRISAALTEGSSYALSGLSHFEVLTQGSASLTLG